ncbi:protein of unknown function [Mucilaginibacter pineti]|uniref:DUF4279 domain-containing protein n=1 Tax=Mucilaginibacter pineti TaxID=1391627 RepID=A0A1G7MWB1_9SPHI|nr:DUF4279 domain-containing protein [Mucilaginibacter pineti]SDF65946.1 protein of unknown function [Mucilaginibacter pineti]
MSLQDQISKAVITEIEQQNWGATEQFMQIHEVVKVDEKPKVEHIVIRENIAIAYLPVKNERFHLAIHFDVEPEMEIRYVGTEDYNKVYLRSTSDTLTAGEIAALTTLSETETFNTGDKKTFGKALYKFSGANYEPNPGPDSFENKIEKLLDYLEQDRAGVKALVNNANACIQVDKDIHNGNGLIGGPYINKQIIKRMAALDLEIAFSQYAAGNSFQ